ncbi:hypothetical protein GCM10020218_104290 [Dactylosporangium vinaceum]
MADRFYNLLDGSLGVDTPPHVSMKELWEDSKDLRTELIQEAYSAEVANGGYGVRRADVITRAGRYMGVVAAGQNEPNGNNIVDLLKDDPRKRRVAEKFFDWIDEIYRLNQALSFGSYPMTVAQKKSDFALIGRAMLTAKNLRYVVTESARTSGTTERLYLHTRIPRLDYLAKLEPTKILELRNYGHDWRSKAEAFVAMPTSTSRLAAEKALEVFAKKLRSDVKMDKLEATKFVLIATLGTQLLSPPVEFIESHFQTLPWHVIASFVTGGIVAAGFVRAMHNETVSVSRGDTIRQITSLHRASPGEHGV